MTQIERLKNQIVSLEAEQQALKEQWQQVEGGLRVCRHMLGALEKEQTEAQQPCAPVDEPSKENA